MAKATHYCNNCGSIMKPRKKTQGFLIVEIILWIAFIVPGLIYTIWRTFTKYKACRECNSRNIIPVDSPRGKEILERQSSIHSDSNPIA